MRQMLTDAKVRNAKGKAKPYKLADGGGMYLLVTPTGAKLWRLKYRVGEGKKRREKVLALGSYPVVPLAGDPRRKIVGARDKREEAKRQLADNLDPSFEKQKRVHAARLTQQVKDANTFEGFAAHWVKCEARDKDWSPGYCVEVKQSIARHLESLNRIPMAEITAPVAASVLRTVEEAAPLMAEKVRRRLRSILDFAVEQGVITGNPLPARRRGKKVNRRHFPAVTEHAGIGEILRKARAADPAKGIARAHVLVTFTAQRISEVVGANWDEFDLGAATWSIPRERMKVRDEARGPHPVPIPRGLLAELKAWREADGPDAALVCPSPRDLRRPITPEGVEKFYRDVLGLGGKHSPHSWRSAFKTICANAGKDSEVIEAQLDHLVGNKVASAYDRAKRLDLRRTLMAWYERELIAARDGGDVVPLTRATRRKQGA